MLVTMSVFSIGAVVRDSLRVWKANFLPFTVLSLLVQSPALVLRLCLPEGDLGLYMIPVGTLLSSLLAAVVTYGVIMELNGTRPSFSKCVRLGLAQLGPVIGVAFSTIFLGSLALLLLIVPGVIVYLRLYVAVPVAVIEKLGVIGSLKRSRALVDGHKPELLVLFGLSIAASMGLHWTLRNDLSAMWFIIVSFAVNSMWEVFASVNTAVAYSLLRHEKEGTRPLELAAAFATVRRIAA
jgi:uncharacterized membrane protein